MEFLVDYGLFIAKTITILVALAIAVAIVASAAMKNKKSEEDVVDVEKLNERFDDYKELMTSAILPSEQLKKKKKEEKKQEKLEKKKHKKDTKSADPKRRVFVASFDGDVKASEVDELRKIITTMLTVASKDDEVVIKLESQGGMVHSYGLAASQLVRITNKGIPLTVCVDKVAASGGYMMACVANKVISAPFAILGSIGVVAQLPNFHRLLKKSNVDYEMYTAGEYKRTLTMFGENTEKGREKFVEDLEDTHELFKQYVAEHRPVVDVADVATGEIWFGTRALEKKLVDEIKTSDEYLLELSESADIYELSISPKKNVLEKLGVAVANGVDTAITRVFNLISQRYYS